MGDYKDLNVWRQSIDIVVIRKMINSLIASLRRSISDTKDE
jgi:hypothetical protein